MTRAMHGWGRMAAVAGVSAGVGAVLGALGIAGYRRSRERSGTGMFGDVRGGNRTGAARERLDARFEAMKMDESPSTFAAGDEVGGDVIGEIRSEDIATSDSATSIGLTNLVDTDRTSEVSEGNYRAADGFHTEEVPRGKGPKGKRAANSARTRKNLNGH